MGDGEAALGHDNSGWRNRPSIDKALIGRLMHRKIEFAAEWSPADRRTPRCVELVAYWEE
jgi:hypothetical protein